MFLQGPAQLNNSVEWAISIISWANDELASRKSRGKALRALREIRKFIGQGRPQGHFGPFLDFPIATTYQMLPNPNAFYFWGNAEDQNAPETQRFLFLGIAGNVLGK